MPPKAKAPPLPPLPLTPKQEQALRGLSITEKTLVVQAVYETGTAEFKAASKLLQGHPLLVHRPKHFFSPEKMATVHAALSKQLGLSPEQPQPQHSAQLLQVARKWYLERVYELRGVMQQHVDRFKDAYKELEALKAGEMDWKLTDPGRLAAVQANSNAVVQTAPAAVPSTTPPPPTSTPAASETQPTVVSDAVPSLPTILNSEPMKVQSEQDRRAKKRKVSVGPEPTTAPPAAETGLGVSSTPLATLPSIPTTEATSTPTATTTTTSTIPQDVVPLINTEAPESIIKEDTTDAMNVDIDPLAALTSIDLDIEAGVAAAVAAALGGEVVVGANGGS
ncbi:BZ3500_MvSof-1268-A1-R1_Chr10-2g02926 [Microbotryum saponariae]|uniref:BZ3500_MvSof-1268-A1-R1_Chr10-2g02926 protein n=1 Tax=Microbotryum saponariae TaxID=289078 RepID=A0A2X0M9I5_9BASI|nr:BZ3501_MvSof-1269-A2-R1_Chr10-2g02512 [Microbotryum saponariae]SDA01758.1 BZ3500_MvSof-1268-A1-R1_Chr10-2g02926 [Microbotryum saponariae]